MEYSVRLLNDLMRCAYHSFTHGQKGIYDIGKLIDQCMSALDLEEAEDEHIIVRKDGQHVELICKEGTDEKTSNDSDNRSDRSDTNDQQQSKRGKGCTRVWF